MKKKSLMITLGAIAVVVLWAISANNGIVRKAEDATSAWGNVQADYQHRKDLVAQAINIVKGAGNYERGTLEAVIKARNNAPQLNPEDLTEENVARFQKAYDQMAQEMSRAINVTVERYPELTATKNYQEFQQQVEGCENRINVSRKKFNEKVQIYNKSIIVFPNSIIAKLFGHDKMGYFQASEGADQAPATDMLL
ncbi:MAG: LemA family protein [Bacteroidales bacterium]|nr:LemA family protein [Bacteroidales bacterium]